MKKKSVKDILIKELADGDFHSGSILGKQLNLSRTSINKHINALQELGLDIYKVPGKGYCLSQPLDLLDLSYLKSNLIYSENINLFSTIDSTNQFLLNKVHSLNKGALCCAEYQALGRGRRGRKWVSPFGMNLYCSLYWRLDSGMNAAIGMSLVVGVVLAKTLEQLGCSGVKLKWPNDLYLQGKKLAGVLIEMQGQIGEPAHLVIGCGLNLAMQNDSSEITQPWISLAQVYKKIPDKNKLTALLVNNLVKALECFEKDGLIPFVKQWNELDLYKDCEVKIIQGTQETVGIERGIDQSGAILIETISGITPYIGGEISLRKK